MTISIAFLSSSFKISAAASEASVTISSVIGVILVASSSARERVLFCKKENTELNLWLHHGSSKPGKRSFGRFSRPLLEDGNAHLRPPHDNNRGGGQYD